MASLLSCQGSNLLFLSSHADCCYQLNYVTVSGDTAPKEVIKFTSSHKGEAVIQYG